MNDLSQLIWMAIAICALFLMNRRLRMLGQAHLARSEAAEQHADATKDQADATRDIAGAVDELSGLLRNLLRAAEKEDDAKRLQARMDAVKNTLLRNWPESRRGDWIIQFSGESAFSQPNEGNGEIRLSYPDQEPSITITVNMDDPVLVIGTDQNCALLRAIGNHDQDSHDFDYGCSASIYHYEAEEVLAEVGEFLSDNPRGFPAEPEDGVEEIGEETMVDEDRKPAIAE